MEHSQAGDAGEAVLMRYKMTTINSGTRVRQDHNVYASVLTSVNANVTVQGDELWTAPADGNEVKRGDGWVKVTVNGVTGWMAHIHKGVAICKDFVVINTTPSEPVGNTFPVSFTLTNSDPQHPDYGKKAEYEFVKVLE